MLFHSQIRFFKMAMILFGVSGGLSFFTIATVLMFRLSNAGLEPHVIGLFAFAGLPYNIRFLWPFVIDRVRIPYLSQKLGQRKSWGILSHMGSMIGFLLLGCFNPLHHLYIFFIVAMVTAFFSSTQDIISDAYRFDFDKTLPLEDSVTLQTLGFRCGQCLASSIIPILSGVTGWLGAHIGVIFIKVLAVGALLYLHEPSCFPYKSSSKVFTQTREGKNLFQSFTSIIIGIVKKPFVMPFLISLIFLRCIDTILGPMQTIFIGQLGISSRQFGFIKNGFGFFSTIMGVILAGYMAKKMHIIHALMIGAFLQSCSALLSLFLIYLPTTSSYFPIILGFISMTQELFLGIINTLIIIYISLFCEHFVNIYHFTIFSTIGSITRTLFTSLLSIFYKWIGWINIFCLPIFIYSILFGLFIYLFKQKFFLNLSKRKN